MTAQEQRQQGARKTTLREAAYRTLRIMGVGVLKDAPRFTSCVLDIMADDSPITNVLERNCDNALLRCYWPILQNPNEKLLDDCVRRAVVYMEQDRALRQDISQQITAELGFAIGLYLNIRCSDELRSTATRDALEQNAAAGKSGAGSSLSSDSSVVSGASVTGGSSHVGNTNSSTSTGSAGSGAQGGTAKKHGSAGTNGGVTVNGGSANAGGNRSTSANAGGNRSTSANAGGNRSTSASSNPTEEERKHRMRTFIAAVFCAASTGNCMTNIATQSSHQDYLGSSGNIYSLAVFLIGTLFVIVCISLLTSHGNSVAVAKSALVAAVAFFVVSIWACIVWTEVFGQMLPFYIIYGISMITYFLWYVQKTEHLSVNKH